MSVILVPVDGSSHALKALHIACDLADKYGAEIVLLNIIGTSNLTGAKELLDDNKNKGKKVLEQASSKARSRGVNCRSLALEIGDPTEIILITAKHTGASTIVMGCRGVSDSEASSFGSVSQSVFKRSPCTCISVK